MFNPAAVTDRKHHVYPHGMVLGSPTCPFITWGLSPREKSILLSHTVLDTFGCAKVGPSDHSSRFGKLMKVFLNTEGVVAGGQLTTFMLESGRLVHGSLTARPPSHHHLFRVTHFSRRQERNFDVFYAYVRGQDEVFSHLLEPSPPTILFSNGSMLVQASFHRSGLQSRETEDFKYLDCDSSVILGFPDKDTFDSLTSCFDALGLSAEFTNEILAVVSAILLLGQLGGENTQNAAQCERIDEVLKLPSGTTFQMVYLSAVDDASSSDVTP